MIEHRRAEHVECFVTRVGRVEWYDPNVRKGGVGELAFGVELLQAFMADPAANRIQLSPGLTRVANGMGDEVSEASEEMAMAEGEFLEPMPLPGAVDSFDMEGEMFE